MYGAKKKAKNKTKTVGAIKTLADLAAVAAADDVVAKFTQRTNVKLNVTPIPSQHKKINHWARAVMYRTKSWVNPR